MPFLQVLENFQNKIVPITWIHGLFDLQQHERRRGRLAQWKTVRLVIFSFPDCGSNLAVPSLFQFVNALYT